MQSAFHLKILKTEKIFNQALLDRRKISSGADLIVLAGFLVVLPPEMMSKISETE